MQLTMLIHGVTVLNNGRMREETTEPIGVPISESIEFIHGRYAFARNIRASAAGIWSLFNNIFENRKAA